MLKLLVQQCFAKTTFMSFKQISKIYLAHVYPERQYYEKNSIHFFMPFETFVTACESWYSFAEKIRQKIGPNFSL